MSSFLKLNLKDLISAVISAVIVAVLGYIDSAVDIFSLDWKAVLDVAIVAGVASLLKSLGTTQDGKFLGGIKIK